MCMYCGAQGFCFATYLATLRALQETSEELGHLLKTLKAQSSGLDPVQAAVVRDAHR